MIDYKKKEPWKTTISAIAVLDHFRIPNLKFQKEYQRRVTKQERQAGQELSIAQKIDILLNMPQDISPSSGYAPRLVIHENPFARLPLPEDVFRRPYDIRHRFNLNLRRHERVFTGRSLREIEGMSKDHVDISQKIEQFVRGIVEHCKPQKIILFGSHAYGCPESDSDIDLLVIFPGNDCADHRSLEIRLKLEHDFPLDLLTRSTGEINRRLELNDFFLKEILEKGKVLYESTHD